MREHPPRVEGKGVGWLTEWGRGEGHFYCRNKATQGKQGAFPFIGQGGRGKSWQQETEGDGCGVN